ncbi:hypothetical protein HYFRA_00012765 [Hymenoscyphus fraxineus]|uniref:GH16 domain-containing protein n=1 Tax=Hymenoscyphus fraxineus TaxID=746836 RepID=A0A9N9PYC5_9HELO|nr:hypothetical protein HYFRA_00012765 [Hymenoscyphus fraxineus]
MLATSIMALPTPLVTTLLLSILSSLVKAQTDDGNACTCFRTNGSSSGYFTSHRFFDYRNVVSSQAVVPDVTTVLDSTTHSMASSDFFTTDSWTSMWTVQNWTNSDSRASSDASILMANSPSNVYIEKSNDTDPSYSTYLTLRTSRQKDFQSAAEINSAEKNFQYLSARFYARVIGSSGACAGMFTYLAPESDKKPWTVQEADIEILTNGPRNKVQYTNQPSVDKKGNAITKGTVNGTNPENRDWSQWNLYRLDWIPKLSEWYVNGQSVASIKFQAPVDPAGLMINMWSDGGSWTGNMSLYDEAYLQIQWMEVVYNTSGPVEGIRKRNEADEINHAGPLVKRKGKGCKVVCGIDEQVEKTGTPVILINNTASAPAGWKGEGVGWMGWIPLLLGAATVFGFF